jgi:uncharacterized membrane protein YphA (DoxX/SURF4 family)
MSSLLSKVPSAARLLLGFIFFVFGLNGFLHFLPQPPLEGTAGVFIGGLVASGYLMPLVKGVEVVAGALLLGNRFVPLALTLLAPIVVNIVAFHVLLVPAGAALALVVFALELYLAYAYRHAFRPMLASRVMPDVAREESGRSTGFATVSR